MNLLGFTVGRTKALTVGSRQLSLVDNARGAWRSFWRVLESFAGAWQTNVEVTLSDVLSYPVIYACMSLISSDVGKMGGARLVALSDDDVWEPTESPAFSPVLRKPNHYQNRIQFYEHWMLSKLSYGNTYVLKHRDDRSVVTAMYVLDPSRVTPLVAPSGDVFYEIKRDDLSLQPDEPITVPASEIIHDRMNCLYHPLVGVPPVFAGGLAATMGLKMLNNSATLFANGTRPGGILTYPGDMKPDQAERIKAQWTEGHSGDNYGAVAVLTGGMTFTPMTQTASDSQLVEQSEWIDRLCCMVFGVPGYMVNVGPNQLNNNVSALKQQYFDQTIMRHVVSIELGLDEGLGLADRTYNGVQYGTDMDESTLLRLDPASMMTSIQDGMKAGVLTPNEGRLMLNRAPVTGGNTPYLQIQNSSIAAIDFRERQERTQPTPTPTPTQTPGLAPPETPQIGTRSYADLMTKAAQLAEEYAVQRAA